MNKKTKILILGVKGMLGQDLASVMTNPSNFATCPPEQSEGGADFDLSLWDKEEIDITDENQVYTKIGELKPEIIINCAAYTGVDRCETDQDLTMQINGYAVGYIAKAAKQIKALLIHISTDYIFDGKRKEGYAEDWQEFAPWSVYGESKLLGEELLRAKTDKYYIIRTSLLFGLHGYNFPQAMLKLGQQKDELKIVDDQICNPTYTIDLAKQILYILNNNLDFGIYHITNETENIGISRYEFVKKLFDLAGFKTKVYPCKSDEFDLPAQRPAYSTLLNTKLPKTRDWQIALEDYINDWKKL